MKPRGRPALDPEQASVDIHVRLSSKDYDQAFEHAQRERITMSEWIRRSIRQGHAQNSVEEK